jgi:hypothetical protein
LNNMGFKTPLKRLFSRTFPLSHHRDCVGFP